MRLPTWIRSLTFALGLALILCCNQNGEARSEVSGRKQPTPSAWQKFGELTVSSGHLWAGDAQFAPEEKDGLVVDLPKGDYDAFLQKMDFGTVDMERAGVRVSRLRVCLRSSQPEVGKQIGETWADTATQGVCDFKLYSAAMPKTYEEYWRNAEDTLVNFEDSTTYVLNPETGAKLLVTSSGFGDGEFRVFELVEGGRRCGIEIELVGPDK